ncbi:hypothetical protein DLAC_07608 [Tieghemostelium lacteum]|uniref:Thiamin pyrophosphokinase thiamin-binding domain-containing protein n=1 Tax=Tieghemostelium lacteum TaxID=361077 RepID=A0A151ZCY7_TIELA|nr:hypothetical protein DLAC_07608 [Tieghemostelium lacteum]|eukprot:KYQ91813.1 hypothetical protein DLAC_07608 [Tieghemostelium lacteum]
MTEQVEFSLNSPTTVCWDCFDFGVYHGEVEQQNVRTTPPLGTSYYYSSSSSSNNNNSNSNITSPLGNLSTTANTQHQHTTPITITHSNTNSSNPMTSSNSSNSSGGTPPTNYTSPMRSSGGSALKRSQSLTEQNILIIANNNTVTDMPIELVRFLWPKCSVVICADGGANKLYQSFQNHPELLEKLIPHYIKGDLDSLEDSVSDYYSRNGASVILDSSQDTTDLQKCMELVCQLEVNSGVRYKNIFIAGGLGGSTSHELANLNTLYLYPTRKLILFSKHSYAWLLSELHPHIVECKSETKCSLVPLSSRVDQVTTTGLKWNLNKQSLNFGELISTSNLTINSTINITTSNPLLFLIELNQK